LLLDVKACNFSLPGVHFQSADQQADGGGFTSPIRSDQAVNLARTDMQVHAIYGRHAAPTVPVEKRFLKPGGPDQVLIHDFSDYRLFKNHIRRHTCLQAPIGVIDLQLDGEDGILAPLHGLYIARGELGLVSDVDHPCIKVDARE